MDRGEGLRNKTDSLSAPSDRCHPQRRESSGKCSCLPQHCVREPFGGSAQLFRRVHKLRVDKLAECGHVVTIREKSQRCSADAPVALTCWVVGRGTGLRRYERPDSFFKFGRGGFECVYDKFSFTLMRILAG